MQAGSTAARAALSPESRKARDPIQDMLDHGMISSVEKAILKKVVDTKEMASEMAEGVTVTEETATDPDAEVNITKADKVFRVQKKRSPIDGRVWLGKLYYRGNRRSPQDSHGITEWVQIESGARQVEEFDSFVGASKAFSTVFPGSTRSQTVENVEKMHKLGYKGNIDAGIAAILEKAGKDNLNEAFQVLEMAAERDTPTNKMWAKAVDFFKSTMETANTDIQLDVGVTAFLKSGNLDDLVKHLPSTGGMTAAEVGQVWKENPDAGLRDRIAVRRDKAGKIEVYIKKSGEASSNPKLALAGSGAFVAKTTDDLVLAMLNEATVAGKYYDKNNKLIKHYLQLPAGKQKEVGAKLDISKLSAMLVDPGRVWQEMDQGIFGRVFQRDIGWVVRRMTLGKLKFVDGLNQKLADIMDEHNLSGMFHGKKKRKAVTDIMEHINFEIKDHTVDTLMKDKGITDKISEYSDKEQREIIGATLAFRKWADAARDQLNKVRVARGQKKIGYIPGYVPHIKKIEGILSTVGQLSKDLTAPELTDFIHPEFNNPYAEQRIKDTEDPSHERDIIRLMNLWADAAGRDAFDTSAIHHLKIHASYLKNMNMPHAANFIETYSDEVFAGKKSSFSRFVANTVPKPIHKGVLALRKGLTRSVFPLNFSWNVFIQTSSAGLTVMRYGPKASLMGLRYMWDKKLRSAVKGGSYSSIIKSRYGGSSFFQDTRNDITKNRHLETSFLDKFDHWAGFLTSALEDVLTGHAIVSAMYHGEQKGLSGRALMEYASEGGAKTQSMYNHADKVGLLRSPEIGALVPFQTFSFEVFNTIREMNLPGLRKYLSSTGAYKTMTSQEKVAHDRIEEKIYMIMRATAAVVATNMIVGAATDREPWQITTALPILGGAIGNVSRNQSILPAAAAKQLKDAIKGIYLHNNYEKLTKFGFRYFTPAGTQLSRMAFGIKAYAEGGVKDVSGRTMFDIDNSNPWEFLKAIFFGPAGTTEGREHRRKFIARDKFFPAKVELTPREQAKEDRKKALEPIKSAKRDRKRKLKKMMDKLREDR
jgi:hypothetical protein